ncbi:Inosine-uridine nucleoside N-ribohydrolase [Thiothrix eikelboomii]|uniref:Inosine-uridine nucleoside N-ribohydrolase n=1 Tax=Thiothrix eikelboomii TaxID=92487 RepID=A0A1T4XMD8_9GAMM|nr:nucleoside hydrolase [Thiothrix eikelboomii]SKA90709.1 Inosine-uridine nucleoside N-ribohydrolase [Thiothrix eikelboomii]
MAHKIILDTDPGIDDAMAIFAAIAHPEIELLGLTTTFGNVSVAQACMNALTLVEMSGATAPVCIGESWPMHSDPMPFPDFVHGMDGLGDQFLPPPHRRQHDQFAAPFIIEQVRQYPGEVTLVAIGPLGNLAHVLELDPGIAKLVKQVVIMGGTIEHTGNVSPVAEANIFADPHAADIVMAAEWPLVMVGLDVTYTVLFDRKLFSYIALHNRKVGPMLHRAADFYIDFYQHEHKVAGCYGHDICALTYVLKPELFQTIEGAICVVPEGIAAGQTIMKRIKGDAYFVRAWDERPLQKACMQVDAQGVIDFFRDTLTNSYWQAR